MKKFIAGVVVGAVVASASAIYADTTIQAALAGDVKFKFNGVSKLLDSGYTVLSYQGHNYVPARFVAENLGATVGWDRSTSTITIDSSGGSSDGGSSSSSGSTVGHYTFSNYSMSNDGYNTHVLGEVVNNDTTTHTFEIKVNFYDASGKFLGTAGAVMFDVGPGQKKSFDAIADNVISGVNTYSFQVDNEL